MSTESVSDADLGVANRPVLVRDARGLGGLERGADEFEEGRRTFGDDVGREPPRRVRRLQITLLLDVAQDSQQRSGFDRLVTELARPDAIEAMRGALREGVRIYAEEAHVIRGVYAAAADHHDLRAALGEIEQRRQLGQRATVARLAGQGLLADGWAAAEAENALMVITSFTAYDLLNGLDLPTDDIAAVLTGLCDAILVPHRRRTSTAP